jgi:hypothetical protein
LLNEHGSSNEDVDMEEWQKRRDFHFESRKKG